MLSWADRMCKHCRYGQEVRHIGTKDYRWCDKHQDKAISVKWKTCGNRDWEAKP